jgi:hypothetical protein
MSRSGQWFMEGEKRSPILVHAHTREEGRSIRKSGEGWLATSHSSCPTCAARASPNISPGGSIARLPPSSSPSWQAPAAADRSRRSVICHRHLTAGSHTSCLPNLRYIATIASNISMLPRRSLPAMLAGKHMGSAWRPTDHPLDGVHDREGAAPSLGRRSGRPAAASDRPLVALRLRL